MITGIHHISMKCGTEEAYERARAFIIDSGFTLKHFDEHPAWEDNTLPGEFTAVAIKEK